jgi:aminoglycoside 6'-N-acetyltransferase I
MDQLIVRRAELEHLSELGEMCHCLWPESSASEHERELAPLLAGNFPQNLPAEVLVAHGPDGRIVGFVEVGLRSHADGCNPSHPVGFIEGWYVAPSCRRKKVGAQLIAAAEQWAREQGCSEMASDTWLDSFDSERAHEALGFEVVDRCIHYRKQL